MSTRNLVIVHMYPDLLSTYGDRGNVMCLVQRAAWRGIDARLVAIRRGDRLPPDADLIFLGGGQDRCQLLAGPDLLAKAPELEQAAQAGAVIVGVCGGYQLLGSRYSTPEGEEVGGLSLLDVWTQSSSDRHIGNVSLQVDLWGTDGVLVGFENHGGRTFLGDAARPLGRVLAGAGNNGSDGGEGAVQGNVLGTYLHGPVLPRNPWFADLLLSRALQRRGDEATLEQLDDALERRAYDNGLRLAERRKRSRRAS